MEYYYSSGEGEVSGPSPLDQIKSMVAEGTLPPDVRICPEGSRQWSSMASIPSRRKTQPITPRKTQPIATVTEPPARQQFNATTFARTRPMDDYLEGLKENSACKGFRASIVATFWLNAVLFSFAMVSIGIKTNEWFTPMLTLFFAISALIVLRQFFEMLVNWADSVILRNKNQE